MNEESSNELDAAIAAIKSESVNHNSVDAAAARVKSALFQNSPQGETKQDTAFSSTEDYINAIPLYLAKQLTNAQKILFEEEARQSIPLRRALNQARYAVQKQAIKPSKKPKYLGWFASAAATILVAVAFVMVYPQLPSFNQNQLAQVETIDGTLYQVIDGGLQKVVVGDWINGQETIRTAHNTTAMLVLDDGSKVEISPRAEVEFVRRGRGNRVDVDRGKIIVAASPQGSGTLDVATEEFVVSVTGTIFEVGHGTNGSRVSVIEGEVQVHQTGDSASLTPGQQFASRVGKAIFGLDETEFTWSQNADEYIAMLREISALQQDIQVAIDSEPRYSTRLLNLVPENTVVYGAIPNAPEKIADVYMAIRDRIEQSSQLSQTFENASLGEEFQQVDDVMTWLEEVGDTLGAETVAAIVLDVNSENAEAAPLILSEVNAAEFRKAVEQQLNQLRQELSQELENAVDDAENSAASEALLDSTFDIVFVDNPSEAQADQLSLWLHEDLLVASTDKQVLLAVQQAIDAGGSSFIQSDFYAQLIDFYNQGAEYLSAVDFGSILEVQDLTDSGSGASDPGLRGLGLHNAKYLMVHHASDTGRTNFTADLLFNGERSGVMSWLASPSPMGSLNFFSSDTSFVNAIVLRSPEEIFSEIKQLAVLASGESWEDLDIEPSIERELRDNFIASLGGESAVGLDGPALPTISWKLVLEVYDELLLQETIERTFELANQYSEGNANISVIEDRVGSNNGYLVDIAATLNVNDNPINTQFSFNYAYVNGYLIAAPNNALLERAIIQYHNSVGLLTNGDFQSLLPNGGYLDVSALSYNRLARIVDDLVQNLPSNISFTDDQRDEIRSIYSDYQGASLITVVGDTDSIRVAHSGQSLLSSGLPSLFNVRSIAGIITGENALLSDFEFENDSDQHEVDLDSQ